MEEGIQKIIQLSVQSVAVAIVFIYAISRFFNWLGNKKNGYPKKTYEEIAAISNNHLHSIEEKIEEQTKATNEWHRKQYEVLCEIKGLLQKK